MNQGLIPTRYAKALYKVAIDRKCADKLYVIMGRIAAGFTSEPALQEVMCNPFVKADKKLSLILTAAGIDSTAQTAEEPAVKTLVDFVTLLEQNKRTAFFREAVLAYISIYRKACNISTVNVTSAAPLSDEAARRLRDIISAHKPGVNIEYTQSVDPDLLGGFIVTIDNERLDASIQNELKQLRLKLLSH